MSSLHQQAQAPPALEHGVAEVDGLRIAYQCSGTGPPLALCHAMGWDHRMWDEHRARLSRSHRVITFDQRGSGASDHPADPARYTVAGFGDDLRGVLDALGIARARVLGFSMGGIAAMRLAITAPERVERLILASTMASRLPEPIIERARIVARMVESDGLAETYRFYFNGALFDGVERDEAFERERDAAAARATPHGFLGCFGATIDRPSMLDALGRITAPTLIMVGENDAHYVPEAARMAERIPDARAEILPGVGHAMSKENPALFQSTVLRFLGAAPKRGDHVGA